MLSINTARFRELLVLDSSVAGAAGRTLWKPSVICKRRSSWMTKGVKCEDLSWMEGI